MSLAPLLPLGVAASAFAFVGIVRRRLAGVARWTTAIWLVLIVGGAASALLVRAFEALVVHVAVGRSTAHVEGIPSIERTLIAFGIVGPLTMLTTATVVWLALSLGKLKEHVDPPLAASVTAAALVVARVLGQLVLEHTPFGGGVRAAVLALCDVALASVWGYGLARSAYDGALGGTPFGRYVMTTMVLRGAAEVSVRSAGLPGVSAAVVAGVFALVFASMGVVRLARRADVPPSSLATLGQETMRELARSELRRGRVRPLWVVVGALGNLGGIVFGVALALYIGFRAHVDFGEIDRNGPAAEYAGLLLALGVVVSFPVSAAFVGLASGGRNAHGHAFVMEAGLAAIIALGAMLAALGVVSRVAVAFGVACAPVAFVLAAIGAWIAAGRRA